MVLRGLKISQLLDTHLGICVVMSNVLQVAANARHIHLESHGEKGGGGGGGLGGSGGGQGGGGGGVAMRAQPAHQHTPTHLNPSEAKVKAPALD
ncbi:hypothetical protein E2C01_006961 [Portunus trituberculatus]|uniref:Uncharacterized protein n=1 Tax=Portunus trituberculatus TaxID=210409 RepID=A0A5B7CWT9_PORTR|nr:hypothetical protein [Portunus trituberculatus]